MSAALLILGIVLFLVGLGLGWLKVKHAFDAGWLPFVLLTSGLLTASFGLGGAVL